MVAKRLIEESDLDRWARLYGQLQRAWGILLMCLEERQDEPLARLRGLLTAQVAEIGQAAPPQSRKPTP